METGYDIIFLWVARMIMMGIFAMDDIPFEWVYFHGTVRDDQGQRMSKSKGNGVDPELLIDRYGSDALRFKLVTAGGTGNDQRLEEPRMEAARNFANKLWNASRFVLSLPRARASASPRSTRRSARSLPAEDRWILSRLERLVANADRLMERFELGEAGREMEEFLWDEFCDWYLEIAKIRLRNNDEASPLPVLVHVLDTCLRLLHPYMPYVTEEIWSGSGDLRATSPKAPADLLMTAAYPAAGRGLARRRRRARDVARPRHRPRRAQPPPRARPRRRPLARGLRRRRRLDRRARGRDRAAGARAAAAPRRQPQPRAQRVGRHRDPGGSAGRPAAGRPLRRRRRARQAREAARAGAGPGREPRAPS